MQPEYGNSTFLKSNLYDLKIKKHELQDGKALRIGGETLTWVREGALIGLIVGVLVGTTITVTFQMSLSSEMALALKPGIANWIRFLPPLIAAFFGISAGALVGIGTPKENLHPEQGRVTLWRKPIFSN